MRKWYETAVFYHIYPLGLLDAPRENHAEHVTDRMPELEEWILHMRDHNFTATYIGPLFESVSHGYDTTDYRLVDRRLGTNASFRHFVDRCHEEGIKVVVDGVFNHVGREFFAFLDLKEKREQSAYRDWFCNVNFGGNNGYNDGFSYESWRGYQELVKFNLKNPEVIQYLLDVIAFWVEEFNIDGIRLDCADVLDFDFMKEMRSFCNTVKKDFWLMGEVIHGDYFRWVNDAMLHSVTNYELHKGLYSGHNDHNYFEIAHTVKRLYGPGNDDAGKARLYTFVDNHDVERLTSKLKKKEHVYPVYILNYTLPGIPSVYYGSEFGIQGEKENNQDYALRPALDLSEYRGEKKGDGEVLSKDYKKGDRKLLALIAKLGEIHKENRELVYGAYKELALTNRQYAFARVFEHEAVITAVNNDAADAAISIAPPVQGISATDLMTGEKISLVDGRLDIAIPGNGGRILKMGD